MKKLFLYIIASGIALTVLSCNKEQDNIVENEIKAGEEIELIGVIKNETVDNSKTSYELSASKATFSWSQYDEIWLVVYNSSTTKQSKYRFYAKESTESSAFTADYTFDKDGQSPTSYSEIGGKAPDGGTWEQSGFAIYPVSVDASRGNTGDVPQRDDYLALASDNGSSETVSVSLSSSYTLSSLDNQLSSVPMIGLRDGSSNLYNFYPAVGLLAFTLADVPTSATAVRLTSFSDEEPLSGTFTLNSSDPSISMSRVTSANRTRTVTLPSRASTQDVTVYVALPVGTITNGLRIELLDGTDYPIFKRKYSSSLEIERGVIKTVALSTPEWKKLGTGKFIDTVLWGLMKFVENSYDEVGYVDVVVEQNITDNTQYRIQNPYGAAASYLTDVNTTQSDHTDYLTFSIDSDGKVTFSDFQTGFIAGGINYTIKQSSVSTASDILITGLYTNPSIVQLAPDYYDGESRQFQRNASTNVVRIVFPSAVSTSEGSVSISGNPDFSDGAQYTNNANKLSMFVSSTSVYGYAAANRHGGYSESIGISTKSTGKTASSGTLTSGNLGVTTSYFSTSQVLYIYWYTYDSSGNILMQGCRRFYYLIPSDETAMTRTFTAPTADECTTAGSSETPSFSVNTSYFSTPAEYSMTFAPSDDLTKGNIMVTEFSGISGNAYGYYNASATYPVLLYINEPFCNANGTDFYLREYYANVGTSDGQDYRGTARFKLDGTYYGGVNNGIACWGSHFGLYLGNNTGVGGTAGISVSPFFSIE